MEKTSFTFLFSFALLAAKTSGIREWHYSCEDENPFLCPILASNGSCLGRSIDPETGSVRLDVRLGAGMLSGCRESCRRYYEENEFVMSKYEKAFVRHAGGLGDNFTDLFGYTHAVCDLRSGYLHKVGSLNCFCIRLCNPFFISV